MNRRAVAGVVAAACVVFVGCSGDDGGSDVSDIVVTDAFLGETDAGSAAALYLTIEQRGGDDRLVGVVTDVSDIVGVMPAAEDMTDALTDRSVGTDVPAGDTVEFAPGGEHLMVVNIDRSLVAEDEVAVTLQFERHAPVTVSAVTLSLLDINERAADQRESDGEGADR